MTMDCITFLRPSATAMGRTAQFCTRLSDQITRDITEHVGSGTTGS